MRSYSSVSGKWSVSTDLQSDGVLRDDWGKSGSVISHNNRLWWIDLAYGIIVCDPFVEGFLESRRGPFAEVQKLHFVPLPGPSIIEEQQDYIDKKRFVRVSGENLRYVLLDTHAHAPTLKMWTLDEPDTAHWSLHYIMSLSEVTGLPLSPKLALIHPLDSNILYFFKSGLIFVMDVQSRRVLQFEKYSMIFPQQQHHCSRFVFAYRSPAAAPSILYDPISSVQRKQVLQHQDNKNGGIETVGNIADDGPETVGNTSQSHRGKLITPDRFCPGTSLSESDVHLFKSAQDLRDSIDANTSKWISNEQGWAMLKNPSTFQVTAVGAVTEGMYRREGSCMLADHSLLEKIQPADYAYSSQRKQLKEKMFMLKFPVTNLCQHIMKGNLWERRRLSIQGDDTFSVIQWRITAKRTDGEEASRRGCEELAAKGVLTVKLPPAEPDASRQTPDADAAASNAPGRGKNAEAGLSVDERMNQLLAGQQKIIQMVDERTNQVLAAQQKIIQRVDERINQVLAGQQKIIQMAEQLSKRLDQVAPVPTPTPAQAPLYSAQAQRSTTREDSNRDAVERADGHRR